MIYGFLSYCGMSQSCMQQVNTLILLVKSKESIVYKIITDILYTMLFCYFIGNALLHESEKVQEILIKKLLQPIYIFMIRRRILNYVQFCLRYETSLNACILFWIFGCNSDNVTNNLN